MNIVFLCNMVQSDVIRQRNNISTLSQAANNKIDSIRKSLEEYGVDIKLISIGDVNNCSFKFFKGFKSKEYDNLIYCSLLDMPIISKISSCISLFLNLIKQNREKKIDYIILYNYTIVNCIVGYLFNKFYKIKVVIDYEESLYNMSGANRIKRYIWKKIECKMGKIVSGSILVTSKLESNKNYVIARGTINEKLYEKSKNIKEKNSIPIIMYSGGLDEDRGVKILLDSLKYIEDECEIWISGKGELDTYIKEFGDSRVKYLGFLEYEEVQIRLIKADILVNPQLSRNSFGDTSFPSKIFEYLSTGNLIVSSDVSDVEMMHENSFYIYHNDDSIELANKISEAIKDIKNKNYEKYNNMNKLREKFTTKNLGKELMNKVFV